MSKLIEDFENIEWTDNVSGIDHWIESDEAIRECAEVARNFTLSFLKWRDNTLTQDELDKEDPETSIRFFEDNVY
jgi:hypothetical protein